MKLQLDQWQEDVLNTKGNLVLRSGRQVGKSTVISIKAAEYALKHPKKTILVIASVERQAYLLFEKTLEYIYQTNSRMLMTGKNRPTKSKMRLKNGSIIYCLPTGLSGHGIRGYTIDLLIADEAAFIPEEVWTAVTPMLAVTRGDIILLSTPFGKGGYFYRCFQDPVFTSFHVSSEDCPRKNQDFLDQEKKRMSKLQYAQEYLGEFVDELRQFFPTALIQSCMKESFVIPTGHSAFLGVDVARMGRDDSVLFSLAHKHPILYELDLEITSKNLLTETKQRILNADERHNYRNIYLDDGGLGVGVFDMLLDESRTRRKVIPINNSSRSIDSDKEKGRKKRLLKEDLYNHLLSLMEQGRLKLKENADVLLSLKSVQTEYTDDGKLKIFGNYTHIAEALIRAAWGIKSKSLNIYFHSQ